jgi:hypothetical protein
MFGDWTPSTMPGAFVFETFGCEATFRLQCFVMDCEGPTAQHSTPIEGYIHLPLASSLGKIVVSSLY